MSFTGNGITNCCPDQVEDFISIAVLRAAVRDGRRDSCALTRRQPSVLFYSKLRSLLVGPCPARVQEPVKEFRQFFRTPVSLWTVQSRTLRAARVCQLREQLDLPRPSSWPGCRRPAAAPDFPPWSQPPIARRTDSSTLKFRNANIRPSSQCRSSLPTLPPSCAALEPRPLLSAGVARLRIRRFEACSAFTRVAVAVGNRVTPVPPRRSVRAR